MATTMHWSPNFSAASLTNARRATAAVLMDTLSAPEASSTRMSSTVAHAAPDGQRHEARFGGTLHHIKHDVTILVARGDVEERQLVGAGIVVGDRGGDRIAGVAQIDEIDAFDDPAVFHVKTGNDADLEHFQAARAAPISLSASAASSLPS